MAETKAVHQHKVVCKCRLYSSAFFNDTFPPHTPPEIANSPLEGVVLAMKALGIDKVASCGLPVSPLPSELHMPARVAAFFSQKLHATALTGY